ncbi:hypothetical protein D3C76_1360720 [compost metagenome]
MGVGKGAEQDGRVEGLDQRKPGRDRPYAVAGGQVVRHEQVGVGLGLAQLDTERVLAGGGLDSQGDHRVRGVDRLIHELVGDTEVDVTDGGIAGHGFFAGDTGCAVVRAA